MSVLAAPRVQQLKEMHSLDRFDPEFCEGIDDLYAHFWTQETRFTKEGDGPFADPQMRAYGFAHLIGQLVKEEDGHIMHDGSPVPESHFELANEIFEKAVDRDVWNPRGATTGVKRACQEYKTQAEGSLDSSSAVTIPDNDYEEGEYDAPRDRADEIALQYLDQYV